MSVLIKCMKMPKTCGECRFSVDGWCYAIASNDDQPGYIKPYEKTKWCPLCLVPPHGRLIDADALLKLLDSCMFPSDMVTTRALSMATNWLKDAPAVIPADKDGET